MLFIKLFHAVLVLDLAHKYVDLFKATQDHLTLLDTKVQFSLNHHPSTARLRVQNIISVRHCCRKGTDGAVSFIVSAEDSGLRVELRAGGQINSGIPPSREAKGKMGRA